MMQTRSSSDGKRSGEASGIAPKQFKSFDRSSIATIARVAIFAAFTLAAASGCATKGHGPYTGTPESTRNPDKAERLNQEAADVIDTNPAKAEKLLREALTFDLYHGPAHNNLGIVLLQKGQLYDAAGEFEWARKLLPGHPDPRMNLAYTLELAGRTDEAITTFRTALEVYPDHLPTIQAITRLQIRAGKKDADTPRWLKDIAMRGESEHWRNWARLELAKGEK